jgi:hypothetical protein
VGVQVLQKVTALKRLLIENGEFLIRGLELLVRCLQFLVRRLQFLRRRLQFLRRRLEFLVYRLELGQGPAKGVLTDEYFLLKALQFAVERRAAIRQCW